MMIQAGSNTCITLLTLKFEVPYIASTALSGLRFCPGQVIDTAKTFLNLYLDPHHLKIYLFYVPPMAYQLPKFP